MNGIRSYVPPTLRTLALLLIVLMVGVVMMSAQTKINAPAKKKAPTATKQAAAQTTTASPDAGQRIYIDPVTKQIVQPSAEDIQALDNARLNKANKRSLAAPSTAAPESQEFVTKDGFFGVVVPEEAMVYSVATQTADGKVTIGCVDGKKQAESVVTSKPAPAKSEVPDVQ
jgi:hypothetical protein